MAGHPEIFILDGSRTKWVMEGRPTTDVVPEVQQVDYVAQKGDVRMRLGRDNLLDKLKEDFYTNRCSQKLDKTNKRRVQKVLNSLSLIHI